MNTKLIVWTTILLLIAYDVAAELLGWRTISAVVRDIDFETGTLFRWFWLALWFHFFVAWGSRGYYNP
jgi:hypothetical protein